MRKNYLINKKFQFNFLLKFVALLATEAFLIMGLVLFYSNDTITAGYLNSTLRIENTPDFFFFSLALMILIVAVGIGTAGMLIFIFFSHRIAGPLYRFETILKELSEGNLSVRMDLRKTDQFSELKDAVNLTAASLDNRVGKIKNALSEIEGFLKEGDPKDISGIRDRIALIKEEICRFRTS